MTHTHTSPATHIHPSHKPPNTAPSLPAPPAGRGGVFLPQTTHITHPCPIHTQARIHVGIAQHPPPLTQPPMRYPMCGQFTSSGLMAGNCPSMSGLKHDRHNNALHLHRSLLERHNGGRWETTTSDFNNKPIKSFTSPTLIHTPLDFHPLTPFTCPPPV
jgi:hypothetical protein